ncbi:MAG: hypothetical protein RSD36_18060 [Terrisporobacter sp.]
MENIYKLISNMSETQISETQAKRAYLNSLIKIKNEYDLFYYLASMNLLNSYVKKDYATKEFKHNYCFKNNLTITIEEIIYKNFNNVNIFISKDVVYIEVFNVQFSFHNIKYTKILEKYRCNSNNSYQEWKGIRLQPIAADLFDTVKDKYVKNNKRVKSYV